MSLIAIPVTFSPGTTIVSSQVNSCFSTIYNDYNGNIGNSNLSSSLTITDTHLAQITDTGKVSATALTNMGSLLAGAGVIPVANLPVGTSVGNIVQLVAGSNAALPAVSGHYLTDLYAATLANITNYGSSSTSGSSVSQSALKIVYGAISMSSQTTQTITNLPFTSSSSYVAFANMNTYTQQGTFCPYAVINSASQITLYTNTSYTISVAWICIGY